MITIRLCGGLGNQLFQWAIGRALEARGYTIQYDTLLLERSPDRRYLLGELGLDLPICIPADRNVLCEGSLRFHPNIFAIADGPITLDGYWQSEKYFADIAGRLREEALGGVELGLESCRISHAILERRLDSCFIHVRRSDNLRPTSTLYHGLTDGHAPYYQRAIKIMRERFPGVTFFVFSDDPEYIKANFTDSDMVCVTHNAPSFTVDNTNNLHKTSNGREVEDLYLMSLCRHAIIANSTFSWWGAWLNIQQDGLVIAPDPWFSGETTLDATDIIPERWMKVSTR